MSSILTLNSLLPRVMSWPVEDRLEAAECLVASVSCAVEKDQLEEVHRRIAEDRAGRTARLSGLEALNHVRRAVLGGP